MNEILRAVKRTVLTAASVLLLFTACEGPMGPSGQHAQGVDVIPPTIELVQPHPLSQVWDEFTIAATAIDNVAIREVVFTFDGSYIINNQILFDDDPPYEVSIEAVDREGTRWFEPGWHFVSARAYDTAGNLTDSPVITVNLGYSDDLQDTVIVKYHNNVPARQWMLPEKDADTGETTGITDYWVRFSTPKKCDLVSTRLMIGGHISDTTDCFIKIWKGNLYPKSVIAIDTLTAEHVSGEVAWCTFDLIEDSIEVNGDFFIMVGLELPGATDSLIIMADDGLPQWDRSGSRDEDGLHMLTERYGAGNNFLIDCKLVYETAEPPEEVIDGGTGCSNE